MQTRNIVIFSKPYEMLFMKYLWPSTINTQNIFFKFYYLTELLFFYFSSISIYNEAKTMHFTIFQPPIYLAYHKMCLSHIVYRINQLSLYHLT
jgi:hypothetical protein